MRRRVVAANWKMNKTVVESVDLARELLLKIGAYNTVDRVICPAFVALVFLTAVGQSLNPAGQGTFMKCFGEALFGERQRGCGLAMRINPRAGVGAMPHQYARHPGRTVEHGVMERAALVLPRAHVGQLRPCAEH